MELSGVVGRNVSWYNHLGDSLILTSVVEDVHSVLGQVPWDTESEEEVCTQKLYWRALSGTPPAREWARPSELS